MKKEIQKGSEEWRAFNRAWQFFQDFAIPDKDDGYWEAVVRTMSEIEKEYKTPLAKWLAYGVAKALNEIAKGEE